LAFALGGYVLVGRAVVVQPFELFLAGLVRIVVVMLVIVVMLAILGVELGAQRGFFRGMLGLLAKQRVAILLGDLVVIGMDFRKGEEAMAVAAVIDERRLERRFDPRDLG